MGLVFRTEEQRAAVDSLRRYLDDEVEPAVATWGDSLLSRETIVGITRRLAAHGLVSAVVGPEYGGLGLGWLTHLMLCEELAYTSNDLAAVVLINTVGASMLEALGNAQLRQRYLGGLARGELIMSVGVSEPSAGSDVRAVRTRARREGDVWVIDGEKTWITNGAHFDLMICTCRTSDDPARGLSHFLIDRGEHPVATRPIEKLALNRHSTAQVFFDGVRVPGANMIGREGDALKNTLVLFERARLHVAAGSLGIARRALDESVRYAQLRKQHGKPIAAHQLIAAKLADMAIRVDAARLLIHRAAQMLDAGIRADMEAAMAKAFATEAAVDICRQAVQIHGGNGVTRGYIVERLAREALLLPIPDGTTEIQQLIIGRALTGISAF